MLLSSTKQQLFLITKGKVKVISTSGTILNFEISLGDTDSQITEIHYDPHPDLLVMTKNENTLVLYNHATLTVMGSKTFKSAFNVLFIYDYLLVQQHKSSCWLIIDPNTLRVVMKIDLGKIVDLGLTH